MAIDFHMAMIHVQVDNNIVEDIILDGRSSMNVVMEELQKWLGFFSPKPTLYTL
jgi:hypothetical protein